MLAIAGDKFQAGFWDTNLKPKLSPLLYTADRNDRISMIKRKSVQLIENQYNLSYQYS